ncbi:patatin-like phospholipase family protein [Halomonas halocynthiae]|uniref:patatin-like phospholipase family protein n=1 Tax=Halomonas halocynthiae TaxID=176290 RepID=UPI000426B668|nr:patatin-like phospholipase family protein [Halomonas halocynthiae]
MRHGKKVGLVLGSGGARGYAHIGVIDVLTSRGYDVVALSGCSMGALVAGVYSAGQLKGYRDWVTQLDYLDLLKLVDVTLNPMGAMRAAKVMSKLEELIGEVNIEDLPIPVTTVATDLVHQREVWFQNGSLLDAIRASIAVPGVITPSHRGDQMLVDGGLLNPLPIIPSVANGADLVIAVNATAHTPSPVSLESLLPASDLAREKAREKESTQKNTVEQAGPDRWLSDMRDLTSRWLGNASSEEAGQPALPKGADWGRLDIVLAAFDTTQAALAKYKVAGYPPDLLIEVPKTVCGAYEFHRAEALIALGKHLAEQALDRYEYAETAKPVTP